MVVDNPILGFDVPSADGDDSIRQNAFAHVLFRIRENQWLQVQDGQLDTATWSAYLNTLTQELGRNRRIRKTWDELFGPNVQSDETGYDLGFVETVNSRLSQ